MPPAPGIIQILLSSPCYTFYGEQMGKGFKPKEVSKLLALCHRRCCICHRFCGTKMEIDHIYQKAYDGTNNIDNAIPVCFECHAEIHSYNSKHPRGRKFRPEELIEHKKQWLEICQKRPEILISGGWESDVGPLQALIDELEFNTNVAQRTDPKDIGCLFQESQFHRAIKEGSISILVEELKAKILEAYTSIGMSNQLILAAINQPFGNSRSIAINLAQEKILEAEPKIKSAKSELIKFLTNNGKVIFNSPTKS